MSDKSRQALESAERLEEEQRRHMEERIARVEAEANTRRLRLIAEAGALLASSVEDGIAVRPFAELVVDRFADACLVALDVSADTSGSLPPFTVVHRNPDKTEALQDLASQLDPGTPRFPGLARARQKKAPVLLQEVTPEEDTEYFPAGFRSVLHVPLDAGGSMVGTVTFLLTEATTPELLASSIYQPADRVLAEELGRHLTLHLENARLYREAEDANRLRDEFLATISHELRTPLQAILGWTEVLREADTDPDRVRRAAEVIERNARAQQHLVDDMLDVSRIITGRLRLELQRIDVLEPVRAAVESVEPAARAKGIHLEVVGSEPPPQVTADPNRLQQVVWNLLSNALKFTPEGGHVVVEVRENERSVVLEVRDDGQGIDPELLPHVFRRFRRGGSFSEKGSEGGLGLGLSIVRHLVEMHGGHIEAESEGPGQGATFRVHLPARPLATAPPAPNSPGTTPRRPRA